MMEQLPLPGLEPPPAQPAPDNKGPIPYDRFQQVVGERNKLKADLEALARESKSAGERLTAAQQELEKQRTALAEALAQSARLQAAVEIGLPLAFADRLRGPTAEELHADARRLLEYVKPASPGVPPPASGGQPPAPPDVSRMSPEEIRSKRAELVRQALAG